MAVRHESMGSCGWMCAGKGAAGVYVLIIMAVALATYVIWRFWEGITAQVHMCGGHLLCVKHVVVSSAVLHRPKGRCP